MEGFRRRVRQFLNASLWLLRRSFTGIFWAAVSGFGCALQPCWPRRFQPLHVTLYTPCTLHTVHFLLHSIRDTLRSTLCTLLYTLHFTLSTLRFTLYTPHSKIPTSHSTHYIPHSTLDFLHTPPMLHLRGRRAAALQLYCVMYLHLCKLGLEGGILDGGTGRRCCAQSRTTITILTCSGKT